MTKPVPSARTGFLFALFLAIVLAISAIKIESRLVYDSKLDFNLDISTRDVPNSLVIFIISAIASCIGIEIIPWGQDE